MAGNTDLPEGIVDATPPGGWQDASSAGVESRERSADAAGSALLADAGRAAVEGEGDELDEPDAVIAPAGPIESDAPGQGADADLTTPDDAQGDDR